MYRFNKEQVKLLADFTKDLSLFFFGTAFAQLFVKVDKIDYVMLSLGLLVSTTLLIFMDIILNLDWLKVMYIVGAIIALALAIVMYPTLKYGPKDDKPRHKSIKR